MDERKRVKRSALRIFTRYFAIAAASISALACIQFLALNHMPGWQTSLHGLSSHRMVNFRLIGDGAWAVAEFYAFESVTQDTIDLSLAIVEVESGEKRLEVREPGLLCARISPDLQFLALGYRNGTIAIRTADGSVNDMKLSHLSQGRPVRDVYWSPDGKRLLLCFDFSNEIVDLDGSLLKSISSTCTAPVVCPPGADYICLANLGLYRFYDWQTGREVAELPVESNVRSLTFSGDMKFAAYLQGCDLVLLDLKTLESVWSHPLKAPWSTKTAIAFSEDNRSLALVLQEQSLSSHKVSIFDIASEVEISSHELEMDFIAGIEFSNERLWAWTTSGRFAI